MELLVSMTLIGILSIAIHFGFRIGINAWEKGENGLQSIRSTHGVLDVLARQIASMVPYYSKQKLAETPVDVLIFQGTDTSMRFVSTFSSLSQHSGGLRLVEYLSTPSADGASQVLLINETPLPEDDELGGMIIGDLTRKEDSRIVTEFLPVQPKKNSSRILEGLAELRFRFHPRLEPGKNETEPGPRKETLPVAVELKLRWKELGGHSAEDFSTLVPIPAAL